MTIDYEKLMHWRVEPRETTYDARETILYALSVGLGANPLDGMQLPFVYGPVLKALPSMALTLSYPGFWLGDPLTGVDYSRTLHGEQSIEFHAPLPTAATVVDRVWVEEVVDKGPGKGALVYTRSSISDKSTGIVLASLAATMFCRADGGFGGTARYAREVYPTPERMPDFHVDLPTVSQAALLYRLTGDTNPLHADPRIAREAGFDRPILHGLCTLGIAAHALLKTLCGYEPTRMRRIDVRFSAPVFPGETIRTEIWRESDTTAIFRSIAVERGVVVLNNGRFSFT
ncbi:MaoC-like dehydratase [Caballeronia temeraria]|uniref:MaoC-like dehydratase n=1 Tax=Caballeronia temeraria TaxID=1777137 RepID=A0A158DJQ7_9BURK|nr:MaoC family dehydratase [Caballeronia temeraria]SAK94640.1 MaoC-like dehydratase [Caballeronia temeraria]